MGSIAIERTVSVAATCDCGERYDSREHLSVSAAMVGMKLAGWTIKRPRKGPPVVTCPGCVEKANTRKWARAADRGAARAKLAEAKREYRESVGLPAKDGKAMPLSDSEGLALTAKEEARVPDCVIK